MFFLPNLTAVLVPYSRLRVQFGPVPFRMSMFYSFSYAVFYLKRFLSGVYHPVGLEMFKAHESLRADVTLKEKIIFKLWSPT
jgi:hypothetical protein